ncbi:hypothetical protein HZS_1696 [Henneguya salminicola]|nr:hypothetical protein HZS_1696 [Henneguya salminicola]
MFVNLQKKFTSEKNKNILNLMVKFSDDEFKRLLVNIYKNGTEQVIFDISSINFPNSGLLILYFTEYLSKIIQFMSFYEKRNLINPCPPLSLEAQALILRKKLNAYK